MDNFDLRKYLAENKLTNQSGGDASISDVDTFSQSVKIEQTLYDGLERNAELEKIRQEIKSVESEIDSKINEEKNNQDIINKIDNKIILTEKLIQSLIKEEIYLSKLISKTEVYLVHNFITASYSIAVSLKLIKFAIEISKN